MYPVKWLLTIAYNIFCYSFFAGPKQAGRRVPAKKTVLATLLVCSFLLISPKAAFACKSICTCEDTANRELRKIIANEHDKSREHVTEQFELHRSNFWIAYFFNRHLKPDLQRMTRELSAGAMQHSFAIGSFLDAQNQLEAQQLLQRKTAQAHKNYHPSTSMCTFGTLTGSLASAEAQSVITKTTLAKRSLLRQFNYEDSIHAPDSVTANLRNRMSLFRDRYCDPRGEGGEIAALCENENNAETRNKDVNYAQTIGTPLTLSIDFTAADAENSPRNQDGIDVLALSANLFAHTALPVIPSAFLQEESKQPILLDIRQMVAKRAVAENSIYNIVAAKAQNSESAAANTNFLHNIMRDFGLDDEADIRKILGNNPSYYAQMEVLTKKLYQHPSFYVNLYDKPANIDRKSAAMQAIALMQSMDRFKGQLRSEAVLSVILEEDLREEQINIQNRLGN